MFTDDAVAVSAPSPKRKRTKAAPLPPPHPEPSVSKASVVTEFGIANKFNSTSAQPKPPPQLPLLHDYFEEALSPVSSIGSIDIEEFYPSSPTSPLYSA